MRADRPASECGFTLLELLVALGVLSLAAGLLASSLHLAWFAEPARLDRAGDTVASAQRVLRERIRQLEPVTRSDASRPIVDARGDGSLFSFAAPAPANDTVGPLQRYRLMLTPAGDLVLYRASTLDDRIDLNDRSLAGWAAMRLLSGVNELELSYYGPARNGGAEVWQEYWIDRSQPPAIVRVRVGFGRGDGRSWPDLVIAPRANANTECRIEAGTGRCEAS